jgi:hypothetical protein
LVGRIILILGDCIGAFSRGEIGKLYFWFLASGIWWNVTREHLLLGFLGLGARNPYGILELGSWIGSVPSWLGGKIQFWAEFGKVAWAQF